MKTCPHCGQPAKNKCVTCGQPACIAKAFAARNAENSERARAAALQRRAAKIARLAERRCRVCDRVLVIRDDEPPSAFVRRRTCCAACDEIAVHLPRSEAAAPVGPPALPAWVDFSRHDVRTVACGALPVPPDRRTYAGVAG